MQTRRLLKAVAGTLHRNRSVLTARSAQSYELPHAYLRATPTNEFQGSRFFCNSAKGDKATGTVVDNSAGAAKEAEKESNGAKTTKAEHDTDTSSSKAGVINAKPENAETKSAAADCKPASEGVKPDPNADLKNLLKEKQAMLKEKDKVLLQAKQQVLNSLAEIENVRGRTRRDAESLKKHAVEIFATELLDMADTLGRAGAAIPESVRTEALPPDVSGNAKLLKSLFEGVDMTEKQLMKIFNKFGVQRFDPVGEQFDPKHHLAIVEVEDESKEPQTIVNVVKSGYLFNDKVIRPAEVGVVKKRAEAHAQ